GYSTISSRSFRPVVAEPARTIVRSARAMRPWRPITFPRSSGATYSWYTIAPSRSTASTRTWSGSSTSWRARNATSSATDVLGLEEPRDRVGRLGALGEPVLDLGLVELDRRRVGLRVVAPHALEEAAVPPAGGVRPAPA